MQVGGKKFRSGYTPSISELEDAERRNGLDLDEAEWNELEDNFLEFNDHNNNNNNNNNDDGESLVNHKPIHEDDDEAKQIAKLMRATHLGKY